MSTSAVPVAIDAIALTGVSSRGGIGTFTRELLTALGERDDLSVSALCREEAVLPPGVTRATVRRRTRRARAEVIEHALRLPYDAMRARGQGAVFHNPGFHAPWGVRHPWVQALHDVIPIVFGAPDDAALRARWKRFGPRYRRADAVIAVSRHAANEGIRVLGLDASRVHVAHHGASTTFCPGDGSGHSPTDERPYILMVAQYSRRKGFPEAFHVLDDLVEDGYPHRLVVAGQVYASAEAELLALRSRSRHPERIELLGFADDLVSLYRHASCFIMPSRYEGFGLPCLEAMACGTPVVAFDNTSLPEIVGSAGRLVPDGDAASMAAAVSQVLSDSSLAAEMAEAGLAHSAKFSWESSAAIHAEIYKQVWSG